MANQTVVIVNPTGSQIANVNAGGTDLEAYSSTTVTLTDAELTALTTAQPVIVVKSTATTEQKRLGAKILKLGRHPGYSTAGQ